MHRHMTLRTALQLVVAAGLALAGCKSSTVPVEQGAVAIMAPVEEAPAPAEEAPVREVPAAEIVPSAAEHACDRYHKCCLGYVDALSRVQGIPKDALGSARKGCAQIEQLREMGEQAVAACTQALEAMHQAEEAYKSMPGFVWPEECSRSGK